MLYLVLLQYLPFTFVKTRKKQNQNWKNKNTNYQNNVEFRRIFFSNYTTIIFNSTFSIWYLKVIFNKGKTIQKSRLITAFPIYALALKSYPLNLQNLMWQNMNLYYWCTSQSLEIFLVLCSLITTYWLKLFDCLIRFSI